eukprot:UN20400
MFNFNLIMENPLLFNLIFQAHYQISYHDGLRLTQSTMDRQNGTADMCLSPWISKTSGFGDELRIGLGDGSDDASDWSLFTFDGDVNGDHKGNNVFNIGGEDEFSNIQT